MARMQLYICTFLVLFCSTIFCQQVTVFGLVRDNDSDMLLDAVVVKSDDGNAAEGNENGEYSIKVKAGLAIKLTFTRLGYTPLTVELKAMTEGSKRYLNVYLNTPTSDLDIVVKSSRIDDGGMVREEVTEYKILPTASGNFESVLPSIALGVNAGSGGELSSQYNVRGGNYDENLVYINDFEIFRPQLIRAGQQEGLSFPNIDLIRDISFSSGGFESKYGNKMSSVLDIRYKRPDVHKMSVSASFLGATAHIEGSKRIGPNAYHKLRYLVGARYKTNSYLLGSLDTKGEYIPDFTDIQTFITYDVNRSVQLAFLGNYNNSIFNFTPATRTTTLGLITNTLRFTTAFEGGERDKFVHGLTGFSINFVPEKKSHPYFLKLLASRYSGSEQENFDIIGHYRLSQIESNPNSDEFMNEIALLGTGSQHRYARNYLYNEVLNTELRGGLELVKKNGSHFLEFGAKFQNEKYEDSINEWERLDSAGYSIPYSGQAVILANLLKTGNLVNNKKYDAFLQNEFSFSGASNDKIKLNAGIRASYIDLSKEVLISPRMQFLFQTDKNKIAYKFAWGIYYQSPFYREYRQRNGVINSNLQSQKSTHYVLGIDYDFPWRRVSKKPFKMIGELYYKKFDQLISYDVDNVRISYSGVNDASGYAAGIDVRVNGEFVKDAESWVNLSILRTREALDGIQHLNQKDTLVIKVNDVARPTDRLFAISMFFQDYLPKNKNFKANINYSFGTGFPFGIKDDNIVKRNLFRYKPYQRLDIGFSYLIWDKSKRASSQFHPLRFSENAWVSLEVFNIMGIVNTASVTWIKTITNSQFAINNNLTSRRLNLRFRIDF